MSTYIFHLIDTALQRIKILMEENLNYLSQNAQPS